MKKIWLNLINKLTNSKDIVEPLKSSRQTFVDSQENVVNPYISGKSDKTGSQEINPSPANSDSDQDVKEFQRQETSRLFSQPSRMRKTLTLDEINALLESQENEENEGWAEDDGSDDYWDDGLGDDKGNYCDQDDDINIAALIVLDYLEDGEFNLFGLL